MVGKDDRQGILANSLADATGTAHGQAQTQGKVADGLGLPITDVAYRLPYFALYFGPDAFGQGRVEFDLLAFKKLSIWEMRCCPSGCGGI